MWNEFNAIEIKAGRGYRENLSLLPLLRFLTFLRFFTKKIL